MNATTIDYFNIDKKSKKVKSGKCIFTAIDDKSNKLIDKCQKKDNGYICATSITKKHKFNINTGKKEIYESMKTYGFCEKNGTKSQINRLKYKFSKYNSNIDFTAYILFIYDKYVYIRLLNPNIELHEEYTNSNYYTGIDSIYKTINKINLFKIPIYKVKTVNYNPKKHDTIIGNIKLIWNKSPTKENLKKKFIYWRKRKNEPVIFNIEFFNIKQKIEPKPSYIKQNYGLPSFSINNSASASASTNSSVSTSISENSVPKITPLSYANIVKKTKINKTYIIFVQGHGYQLKKDEFDKPISSKILNTSYSGLSHLLKRRIDLSKLKNKNKIRVMLTQNIGSVSYSSILHFLTELLNNDSKFLKKFINSKTKKDLLLVDKLLTEYYYNSKNKKYNKKYNTITKFHHYPNVRDIGPPNLNINFYPDKNTNEPFGIMRYNYNDLEYREEAFTKNISNNKIEYIPKLFFNNYNINNMTINNLLLIKLIGNGDSNQDALKKINNPLYRSKIQPIFSIKDNSDYLTKIRNILRILPNELEELNIKKKITSTKSSNSKLKINKLESSIFKILQKQTSYNKLLYHLHETKIPKNINQYREYIYSNINFSLDQIIKLIDKNENLKDDEEILIVFNICRYIDVEEIEDINKHYNIERRNITKQTKVHSKKRKKIYKMRQLSNNSQNPSKLI